MIAVAVNATQAPIHANFSPTSRAKAPIGPQRDSRPIANSTRISGIDQSSRNTTQAIRNDPPPFVPATRGKRQMFPVPTAMPSMTSMVLQREENRCFSVMRRPPGPRVPVRPASAAALD